MKRLIFTLGILISFTVAYSHVGLVYPEGGETFHPGDMVTIEWEIIISHNTNNWDLYFSDDGGATWQDLQLDIDPDSLSYDWIVPDDITDHGRIKVVMDNVGSNYEDESADFSITETVGIAPKPTSSSLKIYPNPARDFITVQSQSEQNVTALELQNSAGSILQSIEFSNKPTKGETRKISLDHIPAGIYFLRIKTVNGSAVRKIIKY